MRIELPFFEAIEISTASEFLSILRPTHPNWFPVDSDSSPWIFRGQSSDLWELVPSSWRKEVLQSDVYKSFLDKVTENEVRYVARVNSQFLVGHDLGPAIFEPRLKAFIAQSRYELFQIRSFTRLANKLGLLIPGGIVPNAISSTLNRNPNYFPHQSIALAQHHGMRTRLIDWTDHPLIAAFFAIENLEIDGQKNVAVWALDTRALNASHLLEYRVPRSQIEFLHAQSGLFTFHNLSDQHLISTGTWPSLEQAFDSETLKKITLPVTEAAKLRRLLYVERVSRAHLMPTLDSVKNTLNSQLEDYSSSSIRPEEISATIVRFENAP